MEITRFITLFSSLKPIFQDIFPDDTPPGYGKFSFVPWKINFRGFRGLIKSTKLKSAKLFHAKFFLKYITSLSNKFAPGPEARPGH